MGIKNINLLINTEETITPRILQLKSMWNKLPKKDSKSPDNIKSTIKDIQK